MDKRDEEAKGRQRYEYIFNQGFRIRDHPPRPWISGNQDPTDCMNPTCFIKVGFWLLLIFVPRKCQGQVSATEKGLIKTAVSKTFLKLLCNENFRYLENNNV